MGKSDSLCQQGCMSSTVDKDVVATWKQVTHLNMTARISQVLDNK